MAFPSKTNIPVAVKEYSQHDLSCQHITTSNFMFMDVALCMELAPKQRLDISHDIFARLEPLPVPTFGRATLRSKAFWVPIRTIMPAWNDFITDTPHCFNNGDSSIVSNVPLIFNSVWVDFLASEPCSFIVTNGQKPDFSLHNRNFVLEDRKFTDYGRYVYKIIRSLGYSPNLSYNIEHADSLLPLFGLLKLYLDWLYPSQFAHTEDYSYLTSLLLRNDPISSSESFITSNDLIVIFNTFYYISYESDYFTSAWDNPVAPNDSLTSEFSIPDISDIQGRVSNNEQSAYIESTDDNVLNRVSQYSLDALKSLTDYMKRHQLVGSRALDRYLSRFGVSLSSEKLNRSVLLGTYSQDIQFGDVTSTSDTLTSPLGSYAGKGITYGENSFEVDSQGESGFFYVITSIVPATQYYQGINRHVMHTTKLDFYTPEFDALGVQAISSSEYYSPLDVSSVSFESSNRETVFGFTSRYAEYKVPHSLISGDYVLKSLNVGKDSWTLFRDVEIDGQSLDEYVHDVTNVFATDRNQYNRIFYNTDPSPDHFNVIHNFNITSHFPGSSLFDTYEFRDEDKSDKVAVDVGGTTIH